jgi:formylmethanofuran dehydrogenase subunit C
MLAGSIIIAGKAGHGAGLGMKRGSMVIGQLERVLPGFRNNGQPDDEWLRIYSTFLKSEGIILPDDWLGDGLIRFTGDNLDLGKGELLVHDLIE